MTEYFQVIEQELRCMGEWDVAHLAELNAAIQQLSLAKFQSVTINGAQLKRLDSAGAWVLISFQRQLEAKNIKVTLNQFSDNFKTLIALVQKQPLHEKPNLIPIKHRFLAWLGRRTCEMWWAFQDYVAFIGHIGVEAVRVVKNKSKLHLNAYASVIYNNGYLALPIIALLSFMIGVVITYQMGLQLQSYGADIYIVDLLGLSILREFAPLLTAIMVAGRTGSAYTAQLGMMKINQEVDALNVLGVTPAELLLIPRIIGLTISLPLLTMWANMFGIFGGMVMANSMLSITWYDFLHRFPHVIPLKSLLIGLGKTPIFALIIATIGCYQGMKVKDNADSVGANTTRSVVLAIFYIIVTDAFFSIILSKLKL